MQKFERVNGFVRRANQIYSNIITFKLKWQLYHLSTCLNGIWQVHFSVRSRTVFCLPALLRSHKWKVNFFAQTCSVDGIGWFQGWHKNGTFTMIVKLWEGWYSFFFYFFWTNIILLEKHLNIFFQNYTYVKAKITVLPLVSGSLCIYFSGHRLWAFTLYMHRHRSIC